MTNWRGTHVDSILDGCTIHRGALHILRVSLSHGARAMPLAWQVVLGRGRVRLDGGAAMLTPGACLLPPVACVTVLADRGVRDRDWAQHWCTVGWHSSMRIANPTTVTVPDGRRTRVSAFGVKPAQRRYFTQVRLSRDADWRCTVAVRETAAPPTQPTAWCVVATNQTAGQRTLDRSRTRMHSEASLRAATSGGLNVDGTTRRDPERLSHLVFALAGAVVWIDERGEQLLHAGARAASDPAHRRQVRVVQRNAAGVRYGERCAVRSCHRVHATANHAKSIP